MAFGLGIMLGFEFPKNFNSPYKAKSFSDFWKRWHIALSEFLQHYLYIPLGGNKNGKLNTYRNLMITMLLGGLWHGASWMFVIWGLLHGIYLSVERVISEKIKLSHWFFYRFIVFFFVSLAWIFFRSTDLQFAVQTFRSCLGMNGFEHSDVYYKAILNISLPEYVRSLGGFKGIIALIFTLIFVNVAPNVYELKFRQNLWYAILISIIFYLCLLKIEQPSPFIYFQF